jgi:hypothetical protein
VVAAIYLAFVVDKEMEAFFLLNYDTRESPKKNAPPLVIFLSSTQLSQSTSE